MFFKQHSLLAAVAGFLAACSTANISNPETTSAGGKGSQAPAAENSTKSLSPAEEEEIQDADEPSLIAGAFLTGVGPTSETGLALADTTASGTRRLGAGFYSASNQRKAYIDLASLRLDVQTQSGALSITPSKAPSSSVWHLYFEVPEAVFASLTSASISARVVVALDNGRYGSVLVTKTTSRFDFTPPSDAWQVSPPIDRQGNLVGSITDGSLTEALGNDLGSVVESVDGKVLAPTLKTVADTLKPVLDSLGGNNSQNQTKLQDEPTPKGANP